MYATVLFHYSFRLKKDKLIVFDIDGTLTNSAVIHHNAFIEAFSHIGITITEPNFKNYNHYTDSFIAKTIYEKRTGREFSNSIRDNFIKLQFENISKCFVNEINGAKKLVDTLKADNSYAICFATGSHRKPAEFKLESIGIEIEEHQLVAADYIYERENIVQKAIDQAIEYNTNEFSSIISIGDGLWDLITAKKLGINFIGIGVDNEEDLLENGCLIHFKDLKNPSILDCIKSLSKLSTT